MLDVEVADCTCSYDPAGNILGIQDVVNGSYTRTFTYDDPNRLLTANTGTSLSGTGTYSYDDTGTSYRAASARRLRLIRPAWHSRDGRYARLPP